MASLTFKRRQILAGLASATAMGFLGGRFASRFQKPRESDLFETAFVFSDESRTGLFEDESFYLHDWTYHPESASRLTQVHEALSDFIARAWMAAEVTPIWLGIWWPHLLALTAVVGLYRADRRPFLRRVAV